MKRWLLALALAVGASGNALARDAQSALHATQPSNGLGTIGSSMVGTPSASGATAGLRSGSPQTGAAPAAPAPGAPTKAESMPCCSPDTASPSGCVQPGSPADQGQCIRP